MLIDKITSHLEQLDLDIRKSHNARYFDQKTKSDVVELLARCILELIKNDSQKIFTNRDIWKMEIFENEANEYFNKPKPSDSGAGSEYNKFISQPVLLFLYSGLLSGKKEGTTWHYQCKNMDLLLYISKRPQFAGRFLAEYYEKIFRKSGLGQPLDNFLRKQDVNTLNQLKEDFYCLLYKYTPIGNKGAKGSQPGHTETNRIFNPTLNLICAKHRTKGTEKGRVADHVIRSDELQYNRLNFRDMWKEKEMPRKEAMMTELKRYEAYSRSQEAKAKHLIKQMYGDMPMYLDGLHTSPIMEVHHIIQRSQKPEFAGHVENLINLSPTQHKGQAHFSNNKVRTSQTNLEYQRRLLIANSFYIEKSLERNEVYYAKPQLIDLLKYGLELDVEEECTFEDLRITIGEPYLNASEIEKIASMIIA